MRLSSLKVALVADWLTDRGGAERVFLSIAEMFPQAPIYTSVFRAENFPELADRQVITSFLQKRPFKFKHQLYPHLRPLAFEQFDLSDFDLVISSSSAESKGIITKPETCHISYCHTPTRYYWSNYHEYLERNQYGIFDPLFKIVMPKLAHELRQWDRRAADRVDIFLCNSEFIAKRIKKYYLRDARVVNPPANISRFVVSGQSGEYFVLLGRMIPYKRPDLAVSAFTRLGLPLKVVGDGPELPRLKKMAGPTIEFLGRSSDAEVAEVMAGAKGLIFPQEEDFGIVPLEAQAAGKPVIAFGSGGALETIKDGVTGIFFSEQTVESLIEAIERFDGYDFDPRAIREHAEGFGEEVFRRNLETALYESYVAYRAEMNLAPRI